jgi:uncharacterized OsmC-like protein
MSNDSQRSVQVLRSAKGSYQAVNARGGRIEIGTGEDDRFTPVELLLTALAACSAIDVDSITAKRAEPDRFAVTASGEKVRDAQGNRMVDLALAFDVAFGEGEAGEAARAVLPDALRMSHDRLCTVSRTIEAGATVEIRSV